MVDSNKSWSKRHSLAVWVLSLIIVPATMLGVVAILELDSRRTGYGIVKSLVHGERGYQVEIILNSGENVWCYFVGSVDPLYLDLGDYISFSWKPPETLHFIYGYTILEKSKMEG